METFLTHLLLDALMSRQFIWNSFLDPKLSKLSTLLIPKIDDFMSHAYFYVTRVAKKVKSCNTKLYKISRKKLFSKIIF